jgi:hypothetical protein
MDLRHWRSTFQVGKSTGKQLPLGHMSQQKD